MPLILKFRKDPVVAEILHKGFAEFLKYHVVPFEEHKNIPTHFVGSVGLNFKDELMAVCDSLQIKPGIFTNEPVKNIYLFHESNEKAYF
jgi:hypothetical protein